MGNVAETGENSSSPSFRLCHYRVNDRDRSLFIDAEVTRQWTK